MQTHELTRGDLKYSNILGFSLLLPKYLALGTSKRARVIDLAEMLTAENGSQEGRYEAACAMMEVLFPPTPVA
jgi:hypothetical protein